MFKDFDWKSLLGNVLKIVLAALLAGLGVAATGCQQLRPQPLPITRTVNPLRKEGGGSYQRANAEPEQRQGRERVESVSF